jgi:hypothetical protein
MGWRSRFFYRVQRWIARHFSVVRDRETNETMDARQVTVRAPRMPHLLHHRGHTVTCNAICPHFCNAICPCTPTHATILPPFLTCVYSFIILENGQHERIVSHPQRTDSVAGYRHYHECLRTGQVWVAVRWSTPTGKDFQRNLYARRGGQHHV